jgi:ribosomal protein S18 acetylase RimI-like enzyme
LAVGRRVGFDLVSSPEIAVATRDDRGPVVDALVAAFSADPVLRYLFPDEQTYPRHAAAFFGHLFDKRVHKGTIWTIERGTSTAMWEPLGSEAADDTLPALLPADEMARLRAYDEVLHGVLPTGPYWYLGVLGTHPESAGRGWGRAVMKEGLRRAAADGLPAILETSNPRNVDIYRRAGWEVTGTGSAPMPIWVMRYEVTG